MYYSFTRNSKNDNPSSKLASTPFMGLTCYKCYHEQSFALHCTEYSRIAKTIYFTTNVFCVSLYRYSWTTITIGASYTQQMKFVCMDGSFKCTGMAQYS